MAVLLRSEDEIEVAAIQSATRCAEFCECFLELLVFVLPATFHHHMRQAALVIRVQVTAHLHEAHAEGRAIQVALDGVAPLVDHDGDQIERRLCDQFVEIGEKCFASRRDAEEVERSDLLADLTLMKHRGVMSDVTELEAVHRGKNP
jgi:hypothetical protein